jgi:cytochrome c
MNQTKRITASLLVGILLLGACSKGSRSTVERPYEAWVLRSVLDKKPRILSIALNKDLWVAYNTQSGGLYKAWTGGINFDGPVYTTAHGPQPTSQGIPFFQEPDENPWRIVVNGQETTPEVVYKGHAIHDNQVRLRYELVHQDQRISVEERPEFVSGEGGKVGFEREFTTSGVPAGAQVGLKMHLNSLQAEGDYQTTGQFTASHQGEETLEGKKYLKIDGTLLLKSNEPTTFKTYFTAKPATAIAAQEAKEGEDRIQAPKATATPATTRR